MRLRSSLLALAIFLAGCGGGGRSGPAPAVESLGLARLGSAAMDVRIAGGDGKIVSDGMIATGKAYGLLGGYSTGPSSAGVLFLAGTLRRRAADGGSFVQQQISVQVLHLSALAVGARFDLGVDEGTKAEYDEGHGVPYGSDWLSLPTDRWRCTGGTVEVVSLDGDVAGVRLTDATFRLVGTAEEEPTATLSGTLRASVAES